MNAEIPPKAKPNHSPSNLTGNLTAILILIAVVVALVIAFVASPSLPAPAEQTQTAAATQTVLGTPLPTQPVAITPPAVNIDKIIITGGILVLIVLIAILREILWYKKGS